MRRTARCRRRARSVRSEASSAFANTSSGKGGHWDSGKVWASPGFTEFVSGDGSRVESRFLLSNLGLSRTGPMSDLEQDVPGDRPCAPRGGGEGCGGATSQSVCGLLLGKWWELKTEMQPPTPPGVRDPERLELRAGPAAAAGPSRPASWLCPACYLTSPRSREDDLIGNALNL